MDSKNSEDRIFAWLLIGDMTTITLLTSTIACLLKIIIIAGY